MTASSLASNLRLLAGTAAGLAGLCAVVAVIAPGWWLAPPALLAAALAIAAIGAGQRRDALVEACSGVLGRAARGELSARLINVKDARINPALIRHINRILDLIETFAKEANTAMVCANERKYYRHVLGTGLRGEFLQYAQAINQALTTMERRDEEFFDFAERRVRTIALQVSESATALEGGSEQMSKRAASTSEQALTAAAGAEQASTNVQAVAAAVEEYSASIGEITEQVSRVAGIALTAAQTAARTDTTVRSLGEAAQRIGAVVQMIHDIAGQTNLLALNATIEAARAGDAGKGFAVVANEVKNLANQTAKATEEITVQVAQMQTVSAEAIEAIRLISLTVGDIEQASAAVAGAVEEQSAVTQEIARNIHEAAGGTSSASLAICEVQNVALETNKDADEVATSAVDLSRISSELLGHIGEFLGRMKAA